MNVEVMILTMIRPCEKVTPALSGVSRLQMFCSIMCRYVTIGHILSRNCLLKQVIEGKIKGRIEVTRRRGRRRKELLDDLGDRRDYSHMKEKALDRTKWRNRCGRGCGPVV
jgi:glycerol-3-phosphate cytidylyltransferase-like family protein